MDGLATAAEGWMDDVGGIRGCDGCSFATKGLYRSATLGVM